MQESTLQALGSLFGKSPVLSAGPMPRTEVEGAFASLPFILPDDYKDFISNYGGAIVGHYPIYGLNRAAAMGIKEKSVLSVTQHFRLQKWPGVESWLIISIDLAGNPIGLAADGQIWVSDHDNGQIAVLARSFEEFLRCWCLKLTPVESRSKS